MSARVRSVRVVCVGLAGLMLAAGGGVAVSGAGLGGQQPAPATVPAKPGAPAAKAAPAPAPKDDPRIAKLKTEALADVEANATMVQQIVDSVFSFGELGYHEQETSRYLTSLLEKQGFTVERGVAGMPTAWVARWGSGKPVIALGSDIDGIPQASQKPGVAYRDPLVPGAPGLLR
jgi:aminobenzoyl-glutamate utilization protein B